MRHHISLLVVALLAGGVVGYAIQQRIEPSAFRGKDKVEAAKTLLEQAKLQAGRGSWERIAVGRVYYLGGMKPEGQAIFDDVLANRPESSDIFRIARVYREADEWPRAKELFDRYVKANPRDEKELAEVGASYLLAGDREAAEALFEQSFKITAEIWATVPPTARSSISHRPPSVCNNRVTTASTPAATADARSGIQATTSPCIDVPAPRVRATVSDSGRSENTCIVSRRIRPILASSRKFEAMRRA